MPTSKQLPSNRKFFQMSLFPFKNKLSLRFSSILVRSLLLFPSLLPPSLVELFFPRSLFFPPLYLAIPSPRLPTPAIYIGPADSEAVSRNKSRLLYKCCQQNRNIAFAYQLFAVQFTRASGGRQNELGTTTENERRRGRSREIVKQGLGEGLQHTGVVLVHVANKLTTAAGRWHLYYDLLQLPA